MVYRATSYIVCQTVFVTLLGYLWLVITEENSNISVIPDAPGVIFGLFFGGLFYSYITLKELSTLAKGEIAQISVRSWVCLAGVAPTVFGVIYCFLAVTPLEAAVLFFNTVITFVAAGGLARTLLLLRWERKHNKVIITSFGSSLHAIPK